MNRRAFIGSAAAFAVLPQAGTASQAQAKSLVDRLVGEINVVIASGKSEAAMYKDFERIFRKYADLPTVAAYAMGVDGRRASGTQKKAFTEAFTTYVSRKYGKRFREFIGGRLETQSVKQVKNFYEVRTVAFLKGEAPFDVTFHVSQNSGKFFNMYIEGINMLLTERAEIGALLDRKRGDIDAMISDLRRQG